MEPIRFYETSIHIRATRRYIPQEGKIPTIIFRGGGDATGCAMTKCREVIPSIATTILRVLYCLHVNQYDLWAETWRIDSRVNNKAHVKL
jgi:hypothetical protein